MHTSSSGAVYNLKIHLVIVTKYRHKVINREIHQKLQEIFRETCSKWECSLLEFNTELDHLHALIDINPRVTPTTKLSAMVAAPCRLIGGKIQLVARSSHLNPYQTWQQPFQCK